MPTDHEEPCGSSHRSFCLNGGICYVIPTIPSPFCRCIENYTGARCEEVFLPSSSVQAKSNLFAAFVAVAVLLTLIVGALYCLCRKGHLQRASAVQYDVSLVETSSASAHRDAADQHGTRGTRFTSLHTSKMDRISFQADDIRQQRTVTPDVGKR
ncbi:pro-neuregulin-4, membrane-bound isoform isoform X2 [Oryctolagus cuniculus]|uniref:pro-neuregulin-4, membrane-bound isoform isoform X2 n=1 Tax=Oryctolagus cuniculus TaxID=9986 RepID=UPI00387997F0